ncbi:MAG: hypothetical protein PVJ53_02970 [Desulfobacterales bacterium]|jgi:3-hydroxymyristoyl/3-hydroxydecanoyl-(acyl carrier protein) dehydratase
MASQASSAVTMAREVVLRADSGWFQGHFPGNPVLPGIAQLDMVAETIRAALDPKIRLVGLKRVRFKRMIRPQESMAIRVDPVADRPGSYRFQVSVDGQNACSGLMITRLPGDKNP